jgi:hypothetical protein|tara:strand:+ start:157 stop:408 length:252 start_codon:yes stop_codon:yes gene_type:complete
MTTTPTKTRKPRKKRVYEGRESIRLGIAVSGATLEPGRTRTLEEIAAYAGCTHQRIAMIEKEALRKLRSIDPTILSGIKEYCP